MLKFCFLRKHKTGIFLYKGKEEKERGGHTRLILFGVDSVPRQLLEVASVLTYPLGGSLVPLSSLV